VVGPAAPVLLEDGELAPAGLALAGALMGQAVAHEFGAGRDAELGEDLMQVVVNRARAEVELRGDVPVGQPHEVLPLTGATHQVSGEAAAENLLWHEVGFLRRHLGDGPSRGPRPPAEPGLGPR